MQIGGQVENNIDIRERALPSLHRMLAESGATSYLCVPRGTRGVCVERLEGRDVRSMALRLGDSLPLNIGAAPFALLAFLPSEERAAVIELLAREAEARRVEFSRPALQKEIEETRSHGCAISDENVTRVRSLITVAMLTALDRPHELDIHLRGAVNNGCSESEIREVVLHSILYCGFPAAIDAMRHVDELFPATTTD